MKKSTFYILFNLMAIGMTFAQNPIIQTNYTADPAPMVYNGKVYLYTSHDEDDSTWFTMDDWRLYTTEDMVNWTDHGTVLSYKDFDWAQRNAWAPVTTERDGKFYMYVPITDRNGKNGIGVAVADSPYGPFVDPLGKPLIQESQADIDPAVFIDDDGQAYLYWGSGLDWVNGHCFVVKLNDDMITFDGEIKDVTPANYFEAPLMIKRDGTYYLMYSDGKVIEDTYKVRYATGNNPYGPFTEASNSPILSTETDSITYSPGHHTVFNKNGQDYILYHRHSANSPNSEDLLRELCVDSLNFTADGLIETVKPSGIAAFEQ